jgi:Domain of unknown function (DUF5591)
MIELRFEAVRSDWYAANTLIPRLIVKALREAAGLRLVGFPAQWLAVCGHYGIPCLHPQEPLRYLPIFSEMPVPELVRIVAAAKARNASRALLESAAALDPVIADLVYIVDHQLAASGLPDPANGGSNLLNTWHSFGRPEVVALQERMCRYAVDSETAFFLPCSRQRPYDKSRTHGRLLRSLSDVGYDPATSSHIVVTAFGVVPRVFWRDPLILTYDAGAVDLWRVFQLLRSFLTRNRFRVVVDCLSFKPFSDMLNTLHELKFIPQPTRPVKIRWRGFCTKVP